MGALLSRTWRMLVRAAELVPLSPLGILLGVAAYAVLTRFARIELDLVWLVVGYALLALCAIGPLAVLAGVAALKLRAPPHAGEGALRLETGIAAETGFALRRPFWLPFVQVGVRWGFPEGAEVDAAAVRGFLQERATLPVRGRFPRIERRVTVADPFGLSRMTLRPVQQRAVDVLPRLGALAHTPALQSFAAGDARPHPLGLSEGDRIELRRYQGGDPVRFIHWKVLARTRKLMVRVPERALSIAHRTAAFLVAGPEDDASAACARLALERRLLGNDWVFGTDQEGEGVSRIDAALDALMRSTEVGDGGGAGLAAFAERATRKGPVSLIVFAPPAPGAWLPRVLAALARHRPQVLIGVDGVRPRAPRPLWLRAITLADSRTASVSEDLDEVVRALSAAGATVSVLDRSSGRLLSAGHRAGMRTLEARVA